MNTKKNLLLVTALSGLSLNSHAAITFVEATDFSNSVSSPFDVNAATASITFVNEVLGTLANGSDSDDFVLLMGFTAGSTASINATVTGGIFPSGSLTLYDPDGGAEGGILTSTGFGLTGSDLSFTVPTSGNVIAQIRHGNFNPTSTTNYTISSSSIAVPEPSTTALGALAGLAALTRRRRK